MTAAPDGVNRALLSVLENQIARTEAAFEGLTEAILDVEPGNGCNSIRRIARHLVMLRRFQLTLLESPRAAGVRDPETCSTISELRDALDRATADVREAIAEHDPADWYTVPKTPRPGKWGDEATIARLVRPLNDFTSHLGAIRAIRRINGCPSERVQ